MKENANWEKGNCDMKKVLCVLFVGIMLIELAACAKSPATPQSVHRVDAENPAPVATSIENEKIAIETSEILAEETIESASQLLSIYVPNDNADGFLVETIRTEDISPETVLAELKTQSVLPDAVSINSFSMDNGLLTIDFNQAFADVVCSMGTSGELMVVGSVVNTFLDAFQGESVYFTVESQVLESGHTIYDFDMSFFFIDP